MKRIRGAFLDFLASAGATDERIAEYRDGRPRLTLEPLSRALNVPLDCTFKDKDPETLARELESKPHGTNILICWHHEKIPDLLRAFDRLFEKPAEKDPQCWGKNAIAVALRDLGYQSSEPFLRGLRHTAHLPLRR